MSLKLSLDFGSQYKRDVTWNQEIMQFPKVLTYKNTTWEWYFYDKDTSGLYDYKLMFKPLKNYVPQANPYGIELPVPDLDEMFGSYYNRSNECDCGARYDRHFPNVHSYWCKAWVKV